MACNTCGKVATSRAQYRVTTASGVTKTTSTQVAAALIVAREGGTWKKVS